MKKHTYKYLLYTPVMKAPVDGYPLLVFLHGSGERGDDLRLVKKWGPPAFLDDTNDFPFMVVSPQCPLDTVWDANILKQLIDDMLTSYTIDKDRIYITGLSIGGTATWKLALAYPELPAAIVPICGRIEPDKACMIKDIPAWVFHGAQDNVYNHEYSDNMVEAIRSCGGEVKYTLFPDIDHLSWIPAYDDPALYEWLLKQKRDHE